MEAVILILSDARGVYIPRDFVTDNHGEIDSEHCAAWGIKEADAEVLKDPEHDQYWDAWECVLNYAKYTDNTGNVYTLHQDGDLWGVCYEKMTQAEREGFFFE